MAIWTTVAILTIMLASLAGVFVVWAGFGAWIEKNLGFLTSFAAGIFLIVSGQLLLHTLDVASTNLLAGTYIAAGAILVLLMFRFVPLFHHHHHPHEEDDHEHHDLDIRRILFGDALHNIGDGLLIAVAFGTSMTTGVIAAVGIFFHELVQEISEFFVLKQGGLSTAKALLTNFAVSATVLIGAAIGWFAIDISSKIEPVLLGVTAGAFLVVVGHDLIPHSIRESRKNKDYVKHIGWFLLGVGLMLIVLLALGDTHVH